MKTLLTRFGAGACLAVLSFAAAAQPDPAAGANPPAQAAQPVGEDAATPAPARAPQTAPTGTNVMTLDNSTRPHVDAGRQFAALDRDRKGYLTRDDVASDEYLAANFERCDVNHDGHLSRFEVSDCLQRR